MSLVGVLQAEMTLVQMKTLAGKARGKGATRKDEIVLGVLIALAERGAEGLADLPEAAQRKLRASPAAQRELNCRIKVAAADCSNWRQLKKVLERFPPSVLLQILDEDMTAVQMKALAGKTRADGAKRKEELAFGVLLALAERGSTSLHDLPASAQRRIESAPAAMEWLQLSKLASLPPTEA